MLPLWMNSGTSPRVAAYLGVTDRTVYNKVRLYEFAVASVRERAAALRVSGPLTPPVQALRSATASVAGSPARIMACATASTS
jgi:hypothetical protein